ncbi:reverse transcriptase domain-containing protein [Tanacetum coccineum]
MKEPTGAIIVPISPLGPFLSSRGNKYILVAVDYLSKWVEAKALPTNDARVVVKFLKSLFSQFGATPMSFHNAIVGPFLLQSDAALKLVYGISWSFTVELEHKDIGLLCMPTSISITAEKIEKETSRLKDLDQNLQSLSTTIFAEEDSNKIGTDISKITRKPSKTGKHGHEERKSTKEARDAKPKPGKVKKSNPGQQKVNYVKSRALIDHLSIKATWLWKKAQGEVGFTLGSLREVAQAVTSRMTAWQSLSDHT